MDDNSKGYAHMVKEEERREINGIVYVKRKSEIVTSLTL